MKIILSALLFLLPLVCWAQTASKPKDLNAIFDNTIRKDTTLKIVKSAVFPKSEYPSKTLKTLTYSKDLKLYGEILKAILEDSSFSEKDKVAFIYTCTNSARKAQTGSTSNDSVNCLTYALCKTNRSCDWLKQTPATNLFMSYYANPVN